MSDAKNTDKTIPGKIVKPTNGGFLVDVGRGYTGFLPLGKADVFMINDNNVLIGNISCFYIEDLQIEDGFNLVLNRKRYIKEYIAQKRNELENSIS